MKPQHFYITLLLLFVFVRLKANDDNYFADIIRFVNVDINDVRGTKSTMFNQCIGAGRASEGLRADWQQQLTTVQNEIGFKYIRFHGLLNDDMHIYTEDANGIPVYNWQYVDKLYDFLLSVKIKPFVEFGFMPPDLASGSNTVFWWKGNITPPKSYEKWSALITALVKHFEDRYGKQEVEKWYFEVWNEPNLNQFWSSDMKEYFKLYEVTAKAVKKVSVTYRVGGPATSGSTWIKEALEYFTTIPDLVDFISTHAYGTRSVFDEFGKKKTQMRGPDGISDQTYKLNNDVNRSAMKGREIHITEWNSSPNPKDPLHDTYQNASYALNALKKSEKLVTSMSYWTFTDIFEEAGPPTTPFHGGFGLINLQGIKKPSFYAFKFLSQLGAKLLNVTDDNAYAAKDVEGNLQILAWDYHLLSSDTSYNQTFYNNELPGKPSGVLKLNISGLKSGKYIISLFRIGYQHNDPFTAYIKMGRPNSLSKSQEQFIKNLSEGRPEVKYVSSVNNGVLKRDLPLMQNDVYFITVNSAR